MRVRIGKGSDSGAVGGQAVAAGERSWSVLFLIKSKFHWSNFKEIYFAQNVTVTQKDKSTIFFSSVHCGSVVSLYDMSSLVKVPLLSYRYDTSTR